jgi:hypothetical protein
VWGRALCRPVVSCSSGAVEAPGSRSAAGRRVSDRAATLEAGRAALNSAAHRCCSCRRLRRLEVPVGHRGPHRTDGVAAGEVVLLQVASHRPAGLRPGGEVLIAEQLELQGGQGVSFRLPLTDSGSGRKGRTPTSSSSRTSRLIERVQAAEQNSEVCEAFFSIMDDDGPRVRSPQDIRVMGHERVLLKDQLFDRDRSPRSSRPTARPGPVLERLPWCGDQTWTSGCDGPSGCGSCRLRRRVPAG